MPEVFAGNRLSDNTLNLWAGQPNIGPDNRESIISTSRKSVIASEAKQSQPVTLISLGAISGFRIGKYSGRDFANLAGISAKSAVRLRRNTCQVELPAGNPCDSAQKPRPGASREFCTTVGSLSSTLQRNTNNVRYEVTSAYPHKQSRFHCSSCIPQNRTSRRAEDGLMRVGRTPRNPSDVSAADQLITRLWNTQHHARSDQPGVCQVISRLQILPGHPVVDGNAI